MVWQYNVYALPLFFAAALSVGLALFVLGARRRAFGASTFTVLLLLIAEWSLADGLEYMSADLPSILFWDKAAWVGLVLAPVAFLIFVLYHTGRDGWLRMRTILPLFIIPFITLLLRWMDEVHRLIYSEYDLVTRYGVSVLQWSWGSWFYVDVAYSYILVLFGVVLLAEQFSRSEGVVRRQSLILIFSVLVPLGAAVVEVLNIAVYPLDWTCLAFTVSGLSFFWAVFRFRLFELLPLARETIMRDMSDGVIVLDDGNRIVDMNPVAKQIFCSWTEERGKPVAELFHRRRLELQCLSRETSELSFTVDGALHYFELQFSPIRDERGNLGGRVGVLRDVTERKRMEEALRESEHKLRAVVYGSPIPQFVIDRNHTIIYWNKAMEEITGVKAEHVLGTNKQWSAFYSEERPCMADLLVNGRIERIPELYSGRCRKSTLIPDAYEATDYFRALGKEGKWLYFTAAAIKDPEGNVVGAVETLEDVTERKRTEDALRESEQRLRRITDNMLDMVVENDLHGVCRYASPSCKEVMGYDPRDLVGKSLYDFVHPEDVDTVRNITRRAVRTGRLSMGGRFECRYRHADGHYVWLENLANIVYDEKGQMSGGVIGSRDITERKLGEQKLRESEERYRSLFNRMLDGVYRSTHDGRFVDVNPAFVKMFAYSSRDEMLAIPDISKALYFSHEERGRHIPETAEKGVEVYPMRRKDGSEIWVEDHGGYVHDEHGNVTFHEGILRDVTERKRMEDQLKRYSEHLEDLVEERTSTLAESEGRYRRLFESSPVSLWEEDFSEVKRYFDELRARGIKDLRTYFTDHPEDLAICAGMVKVLDVNEATLKMYGAKTVEELRGELRRVFTQEFQNNFREELVALGEGKLRFESEFDNQTLAGDLRHVSLVLSVIPGFENTLAKVLVSAIDLTERKRMEERLQQAEHLAAIGETAAMVGHDLRNPLQGIAGATYLLGRESLTSEVRSEMIQLIENCVEYSDGIVNDLLDYARPFQLTRAETTANKIIRSALRAVHIPDRIQVQDKTREQPVITVDSDRMKRVFVNLIENAVDAMPHGGSLTISSKESNGFVEILFSDTGGGMSREAIGNLWRPLQTTKAKGMGLGLPIVKRIIDAHSGEITVESKPGCGTTFTVRLPIKRKS